LDGQSCLELKLWPVPTENMEHVASALEAAQRAIQNNVLEQAATDSKTSAHAGNVLS